MSQVRVNHTDKHSFGSAVDAMKQGCIAYRQHWRGELIFRQVPSKVPADIVPRMTSLPAKVKEIMAHRNKDLHYHHQIAQLNVDCTVEAYTPSVADMEAEDWIVEPAFVEPYVSMVKVEEPTARETVGTATPLE